MKKIIKLLFVFMLFYAFEVKADYNAFLVDSEYTTVVSGDEFKLKAGFDTVWDESVVKDDNQNNELHDFYIAFDSRAFDVNLDNIKYENSNYETSEHTYYTEEKKGYWKKCNRCGQIKLGHTKFFSKNKSSKDKFFQF